jgi:hypothetical protein
MNNWNVAELGPPFLEFIALGASLLLLSINEGYQVAIISCRHFGPEKMKDWPRARSIRQLIFSPTGEYDRLPRLFLGQSFMVVFCTYMISSLTVFDHWPDGAFKLLCRSGIPGILVCVNLAQLWPSLWAAKNPREYLTSAPAVSPIVSGALWIESLGLLHFTFVFVAFLEYLLTFTLSGTQRLGGPTGEGNFGSHPSKFGTGNNTTSSSRSRGSSLVEAGSDEDDDDIVAINFRGAESAAASAPLAAADDDDDDDNAAAGHVDDRQKGEQKQGEESEGKHGGSFKYKVKIFLSTLLQSACTIWLLHNLFEGRSIVALDPWLLLFLVLLTYYIIFLAEGLKIAVVSMAHMSRDDVAAAGYSLAIYDLLIAGPQTPCCLKSPSSSLCCLLPATQRPGSLSAPSRYYSFLHYGHQEKLPAAGAVVGGGEVVGEYEHEHEQEPNPVHVSLSTAVADGCAGAGTESLAASKGVDISRFLLGRQCIVVPGSFLIASIFTFNLGGHANTPWGAFMNTVLVSLSLPSVICTLQFAQLAPQVLAGRYPGVFMSIPGSKTLVSAALTIQSMGLTETPFLLCDLLDPHKSWTELILGVSSLREALPCRCVRGWFNGIGVETPFSTAPTDDDSDDKSDDAAAEKKRASSRGKTVYPEGIDNTANAALFASSHLYRDEEEDDDVHQGGLRSNPMTDSVAV